MKCHPTIKLQSSHRITTHRRLTTKTLEETTTGTSAKHRAADSKVNTIKNNSTLKYALKMKKRRKKKKKRKRKKKEPGTSFV